MAYKREDQYYQPNPQCLDCRRIPGFNCNIFEFAKKTNCFTCRNNHNGKCKEDCKKYDRYIADCSDREPMR